ncbi:helix-turn-helix domain-containing protein, partial [Spongiibacter tropicus]|uniref:helix-turn-helix domain-containing protein n=1 Tax=Spongiibacter tropicus TaxID=454602 RepID=UPI0035BE2F74
TGFEKQHRKANCGAKLFSKVMASGREVHIDDLPPELLQRSESGETGTPASNWQENLRRWADQELLLGRDKLLDRAVPEFEKVMIEVALKHTHGRRRDAANLLGWGRNTLTRKIKELNMGGDEDDE